MTLLLISLLLSTTYYVAADYAECDVSGKTIVRLSNVAYFTKIITSTSNVDSRIVKYFCIPKDALHGSEADHWLTCNECDPFTVNYDIWYNRVNWWMNHAFWPIAIVVGTIIVCIGGCAACAAEAEEQKKKKAAAAAKLFA